MVNLYDRCLKLRSLSRSSCEAEAVSAMGQLYRIMTLNGVTSADLDAMEAVQVPVDGVVTFSRRSLALACVVSRGCDLIETATTLFFVGRAGGVESAREVYTTLINVVRQSKVPAHLERQLARKSEAEVKKLREVCRTYFEIGLFRGVGWKLQPWSPEGECAKKFMFFDGTIEEKDSLPSRVTDRSVEETKDALKSLDDAATGLVALVAPEERSKEYASELKEWAIGAGLLAANVVDFRKWSPPTARPRFVRGLLVAADPKDVARRNARGRVIRTFSSELDIE
jgi:hypothetical protein